MKKALVQDNFIQNGGAERCVESMTNVWNDFDFFSLVDFLDDGARKDILKGKFAKTTFIQDLPFAKKYFRHYLPFYPLAIEQINLSEYDLILSSSYAVAKGVITRPDQIHITYMYSPVRYVWDLYFQYLKESNLEKGAKAFLAKMILHYIRNWDQGTAHRPDHYIAISHYIAKRIKKVYNKDSQVVYPPVDTSNFTIGNATDDYYITSSRMVPYKKIDLIVEAFAHMPDKKLLVSGDGPDFEKIKAKATKNVTLLGFTSKAELIKYTQNAKAFVFAAEEDFGIAPIEAQACGVPVIGYGKGGLLETIVGNTDKNTINKKDTGVFFYNQTVASIVDAVNKFEKNQHLFDPNLIRINAERFDANIFEREIKNKVDNIIQNKIL